MVQSILDNGN